MGVTIRDLAEYCGLSVSAVSKALNGYSDISEATRQAVMNAVQELDYHPNAHARALKGGRSYNLGVLFSDDSQSGLTHPFFSAVLEHFKREAEQEGYDITFIGHRMGNGRVTYLDHCRYREVDGVCMACLDFDDAEVREVAESELPVVTIDRRFQGVPSVMSDNEGGIRALMDYVYSLGHRRIAFVHAALPVHGSGKRQGHRAGAAFPAPAAHLHPHVRRLQHHRRQAGRCGIRGQHSRGCIPGGV